MMHVSPSIVRTADSRDEEAIIAMCLRLHEENGLFRVDQDKVRARIHAILHPDQAPWLMPGIIGVVGSVDALEGMIILNISSMWYATDDDRHIEEVLNYVPPEHRKTTHAKALIGFAKDCAEKLGMPLLIGVQSTHRMEAKVRLYQRQLPKLGEFFMFDPRKDEA